MFQSPKPTTHHVILTDAVGTLQWVILHSLELHKNLTFCKCLYLRQETTFYRSSKAPNQLLFYVLLTGAKGTLQWVILHSPELHKNLTFFKCLYLRQETTFYGSSKA